MRECPDVEMFQGEESEDNRSNQNQIKKFYLKSVHFITFDIVSLSI